MFPNPDPEFSDVLAARVIGLEKEMFAPAVVIDPPKETKPAPFWVNAPPKVMAPAAVLVKRPLFVMVRGPPPVVVIAAPRTIALVLTEIPRAPEVMSGPLNVVVPVPVV